MNWGYKRAMQRNVIRRLQNSILSDKYKFYAILCIELILWPFLWLRQWFVRSYGISHKDRLIRAAVKSRKVTVCVHEWGGYPMKRSKTIKDGATFECGLKYQLDRFAAKEGVNLIVTMSDASKHDCLESIKSRVRVVEVDNKGMDFSGYASVYSMVKDEPNQYIVLSNSSVNSVQGEFLQGYIDYMEQNPDVGLLGVSYCTCMWQTLVRNNFTPHLQSFFLLTTTQVLNEVVALNKGKFPGKGINHKLLLIRQGEIKLSRLVQKLGYRLAVVNPQNGIPFKFTDYRHWKLPKGDIRQLLSDPNKITPISI